MLLVERSGFGLNELLAPTSEVPAGDTVQIDYQIGEIRLQVCAGCLSDLAAHSNRAFQNAEIWRAAAIA